MVGYRNYNVLTWKNWFIIIMFKPIFPPNFIGHTNEYCPEVLLISYLDDDNAVVLAVI